MSDYVEIIDEYNGDGVLVCRYVNGIPIEFPNGKEPSVSFWDIMPKFAFQRQLMTRREVEEIYGKGFTKQ
jgi:hypothetical protein